MTNLDDRYRLLKCVALGGGIRTHNAQDTSTGRPVMVHILDGADSEAEDRIRGQVGALPTPERSRILDISATDAGLVIVSEILSGLTSFQDWLDARAAAPIKTAEAPPPTTSTAQAESAEPAARPKVPTTESFVVGRVESSRSPSKGVQPPGEFTQLFQGLEAAPPPSAPAPAPKPAASPVAGPPPTKPVAAPPASPPLPPPASPPPPAKPAAAAPAQASSPSPALKPGEFTSLFRPVAPPPPQHMDPSPLMGGPGRPSGQPGGAPYRPAAPPPPLGGSSSAAFAAPPPSPPKTPPSAPALGSLGVLGGGAPTPLMPLGAPPPAAAPPPPAPPSSTPSPSASPLLGGTPSPLSSSGGSNSSLPQVIAPPVFSGAAGGAGGQGSRSPLADQRAAGPSDYTMLIRQSATPAPPVAKPAASAPAAAPTEPRRSIPLGLVIALNVVLVLAIALVLYFVFRPAPPNVTPGGALPAVPTGAPSVQAPAVPTAPAVKAPTIPNAPAVKP